MSRGCCRLHVQVEALPPWLGLAVVSTPFRKSSVRNHWDACSSLLFDPVLGERPRVPRGEVVLGCRSARSWGSALGLRVVAAPSLHISLLGPGGEPAVAVCGVNCRRWQPRGLHEGIAPSRGLTVRLRRSDAETTKTAAAGAAAGISSNSPRRFLKSWTWIERLQLL